MPETSKRCLVCEHEWHDERCGTISGGGPLSHGYVCKCPTGVALDPIDHALYVIRQNTTSWDMQHLRNLADALNRTIPDLATHADAVVHGAVKELHPR